MLRTHSFLPDNHLRLAALLLTAACGCSKPTYPPQVSDGAYAIRVALNCAAGGRLDFTDTDMSVDGRSATYQASVTCWRRGRPLNDFGRS